jgi:hypothetical protein
MVYLVYLVCLVHLVDPVSLVQANKQNTPNKRDRPDQPVHQRRSFLDSDDPRFTFNDSRTPGTDLERVAENNGFTALRTG